MNKYTPLEIFSWFTLALVFVVTWGFVGGFINRLMGLCN